MGWGYSSVSVKFLLGKQIPKAANFIQKKKEKKRRRTRRRRKKDQDWVTLLVWRECIQCRIITF